MAYAAPAEFLLQCREQSEGEVSVGHSIFHFWYYCQEVDRVPTSTPDKDNDKQNLRTYVYENLYTESFNDRLTYLYTSYII